jgi:hypothetical protein
MSKYVFCGRQVAATVRIIATKLLPAALSASTQPFRHEAAGRRALGGVVRWLAPLDRYKRPPLYTLHVRAYPSVT